jgi:signal transduction histidine kinase
VVKIRIRFLVVALICIIVASVTGVLLLNARENLGNTLLYDRTAARTVKAAFEMKVVADDYLLNHGERAQAQWQSSYDSLSEALEQVELDDPRGQAILTRMQRATEDSAAIFSELTARSAQPVEAGSVDDSLLRQIEARLQSQLTVKLQSIVSDAFDLTELAEERMNEAAQLTSILIAVLIFSVSAVVLGAGLWTYRTIVPPLRKLQQGTEIIGAGDLDYEIGMTVEDEIGDLSRAFDHMTARLKETTVSRDRLAEEIVEREKVEARLKETLDSLARSNAELEQFAYVASHDLQEPLRMISSYTQLLAKRYQDRLDSDANEFIDYAVDGASRMQILINDLLLYSRVTTRGEDPQLTDTQVVFDQTIVNLKFAIEESGAEVTSDPLPTVMADATQLGQVFQNLVGNAIKFRGQEPPRIHVGAQQENNHWLLSVRDNGIGIDPQYHDRVFVIFQRLHGRDGYQGTGIGLAICKKIVERHGGRIWIESAFGEGTTFYFTVPCGGG